MDKFMSVYDGAKAVADRVLNPGPTVAADGSSVVITTEVHNAKTKFIKMNVANTDESDAGCDRADGPVSQAQYNAQGGSVIQAGKICNPTVEEGIDLSVSLNKKRTKK